ncbi:MAG: hypothetical protein PHN38_02140 [Sulfurospirillaceae bacterium]|nr:hypothetical protein [Sulfurospirillaceae bacterium]MDD3462731.1 hypothetical protein [Sulfurospirillaceae bacterium]
MEQLFPVLFIAFVVGMILVKQIKKITQSIDLTSNSSFELYANFSAVIQDHIKEIKNSIKSSEKRDENPFRLLDGKDEAEVMDKLSDIMRKLVFFETLMAKQKSNQEVEADLFEVLNTLETCINENFEDGENVADKLRETLLEAYQNLSK